MSKTTADWEDMKAERDKARAELARFRDEVETWLRNRPHVTNFAADAFARRFPAKRQGEPKALGLMDVAPYGWTCEGSGGPRPGPAERQEERDG